MSLPMPAFDTLKYVRTLNAAGVPAETADAHAHALSEAMATHGEQLATQANLLSLESGLKGELQSVETRLQSEMQSIETRLQSEMQSIETRLQSEMQSMETRLQSEMQSVESRLQSEMQSLNSDMKALRADVTHQLTNMRLLIGVVGLGVAAILPKLYFP